MLATKLMNRSVVLRELLPQDLKLEFETLSCGEAATAARFLANVVGLAHAWQMDDKTRGHWIRELERHHSRTLDAPSWLWTSIVELLGTHESAYLDHCRQFGLIKSPR